MISKRHIFELLRRSGIMFVPILLVCVDTAKGQEIQASCRTCHNEQFSQFSDSVHALAQVSCQDCHGGQENYVISEGQQSATAFEHGGEFSGKPTRLEIPLKCAICHSDVTKMNPYGLPANQLSRYRTSGHGQAIFEERNSAAAVCTDCHNVHSIYKSSDTRSWTHALNVPNTCGKCHANESLMSQYGHHTETVTEYRRSVHGVGLLEQHDTAMPTCATCHGNHAAVPPGVSDINTVCGRCHIREEQLFLKSSHANVESFSRCIACHGGEYGHDIQRVTVSPSLLVAKYAAFSDPPSHDELIKTLHPGLSLMRDACYECHDQDSDDESELRALKTSEDFHQLIAQSEILYARMSKRVNQVARGVLLVDDERLMMASAKTAIIELGPTQHSLDAEELQAVVDQLVDTTNAVGASLAGKEAGLSWRYIILWPMWIFILILAVASYMKYRELKAIHVKPINPTLWVK